MTLNLNLTLMHPVTVVIKSELPADALANLNRKLDSIIMTQDELAAKLSAIKEQNDKSTAEQLAALAALQAALVAAGNTSPAVDAAIAALAASIQRDDDLNPDAPVD